MLSDGRSRCGFARPYFDRVVITSGTSAAPFIHSFKHGITISST
ncbi:hypothetical protein [Sinorhizobium meliloti]|nr:hypothetical protein [Sinorhizobium meliloti]